MSNSSNETPPIVQYSLLDDSNSNAPVEPLAWRVRTSKRVRNPKIQVFPHGGVEVVVHPRTRPREIEAFVRENSAWIERTRLEFRELRPDEKALPDRIELPAIGESLAVHYSGKGTGKTREAQGILFVDSAKPDPAECRPLLRDWLKRKARPILRDAVAVQRDFTGLSPRRVQVRLQTTRWGSCSTTGTLSLNAALLLRSPEELRYVVIHEFCHLEHMNHSKQYWRLVSRFEPDYRRFEHRLNRAWQTSPQWLIG